MSTGKRLAVDGTDPRCTERHTGLMLIEPEWARRAIALYAVGQLPVVEARADDERLAYTIQGRVAVIPMFGYMQKGESKFGGVSTVFTRRALRAATADEEVDTIVLHIDSPGGSVAGVSELAGEMVKAKKSKPLLAQIEDLGASAAYWVASQADRIYANETAEVGSIGTMAVIVDSSGMAARDGVKVHVIATGDKKGIGVPGREVTEDDLAYLRGRVEAINGFFQRAVQTGRGLSDKRMEEVSDGRVVIAAEAKRLGLIDGVQSMETTLAGMMPKAAKGDRRVKAKLRLLDFVRN